MPLVRSLFLWAALGGAVWLCVWLGNAVHVSPFAVMAGLIVLALFGRKVPKG